MIRTKDPTMPEFLRGRLRKVAVTVLFLIIVVVMLLTYQDPLNRKPKAFNIHEVVKKYDNCSYSYNPDTEQGGKKIIWSTGYPDSMPESLIRSLVRGLTGITKGAKSFYVHSSTVHACRGSGVTVVCLLSRPETDLIPDYHMHASDFSKDAIQLLRNPMTVFPAYLNDRHYQRDGQIPEPVWRRSRDKSLKSMMEVWVTNIQEWKRLKKMKVSLYLPFEYIMDPHKGPLMLERMAQLFEKEGYRTFLQSNTRGNLTCAWYKSVTRAHLVQYHSYGYEYTDYIPGYTPEQQQFLLGELANLTQEFAFDPELTEILEYYQTEIREHMVLDNVTNSAP